MYESLLCDAVDFHDEPMRNIKGIRESRNLFDDLAEDAHDQALATAAAATGRIQSSAPLLTRPFDYGALITYPFINLNGRGTRFSEGIDYGVWYGSLDIETTIHETVHHWSEFIADSFPLENREIVGERRVFQTRCDAILIDLRGKERREKRLLDRRDYRYTQQLGRYLKEQNQNGLLIGSARCGGTNVSLFTPGVLSRARHLCMLTYRMNPAQDLVRVERTRGRKWLEIKPGSLR
ncbi:MAG: RES domain-containing protein [Betaproteobacteria bacterium]|nr:RES domain-containing protein [Betaproteobacteria bacterium]